MHQGKAGEQEQIGHADPVGTEQARHDRQRGRERGREQEEAAGGGTTICRPPIRGATISHRSIPNHATAGGLRPA
ncbi:MAG: hypothetical protein U1E17_04710 [Geminicoccaceae bacterium]